MTIRLLARLAALLMPIAFVLSCSSSTSADSDNRLTGKFSLVSADEQPLPAAVFDGIITADPSPSFHLRIIATSGFFTLNASGHYEQPVVLGAASELLVDGFTGPAADRAMTGRR